MVRASGISAFLISHARRAGAASTTVENVNKMLGTIQGFEFSWRDESNPNTPSAIFSEFNTPEAEQEGVEILFADYTTCCYSGSAFILFRQNGKLYEVNGGHCSCNGLEGQWSPEECSVGDIAYRIENGSLGTGCCGSDFVEPLRKVLDSLRDLDYSI
jgi:hypothetical protein